MTVIWHGDEFERLLHRNAARIVGKAGVMMQTRMKMVLSHKGSGIWYKGKPTRSSKPNRPPVAQTGTLRRSVQIDVSEQRAVNPAVRVGTNLKYGFFLEWGTFGGTGLNTTTRLEPRPWARVAAKPMFMRKIERLFSWQNLTRGYNK